MNEQEMFWRGEFGDEYHRRQTVTPESNIAFFAKILQRTREVRSVIELGAGTGQNMSAITKLLPDAKVMGVEINEFAALQIPVGYVFRQSIFDFDPPVEHSVDLAFTKGLLIHIAPQDLPRAYGKLYQCSDRYILIAEYYSPVPSEVNYRGHAGKLWKADFSGDLMRHYPDVELIDYGFQYRGDPSFPQDDITWFLMQKRGA